MSKLLNFISHYLQIKHYENIATLQPHFLKKKGFKIYHSKNSHLRLILTTPFFLVIVQACHQAVSLDSLYNKLETLSMLRHLFRLATSVSKLETVNSFVPKKRPQNFCAFSLPTLPVLLFGQDGWANCLGQKMGKKKLGPSNFVLTFDQ